MTAFLGAERIWNGTQWIPSPLSSTQFVKEITIGQIDAQQTVQILATDTRFIRTSVATPTNVVPIRAQWVGTGPVDANPIILSCVLDDVDTGQIALVFYNPFPSDLDFNDRYLYFEILPPVEVPP
jgi:hypothetical protein